MHLSNACNNYTQQRCIHSYIIMSIIIANTCIIYIFAGLNSRFQTKQSRKGFPEMVVSREHTLANIECIKFHGVENQNVKQIVL